MNKIEVVIEHFKLDRIRGPLNKIGVQEITISEEGGFSGQKQNGYSDKKHEPDEKVDLLPMKKIQIIANNDQVDAIMLLFTCVGMEWGSICVTFRPDQQAKGVY
jgi:nitrogen regulatory protein P-II 1